MSRLERKNRTDIQYKGCGDITDVIDDALKEYWRISDEEYDYLVTLSDDVVDALIDNSDDYTSKKNNLILINSALEGFKPT